MIRKYVESDDDTCADSDNLDDAIGESDEKVEPLLRERNVDGALHRLLLAPVVVVVLVPPVLGDHEEIAQGVGALGRALADQGAQFCRICQTCVGENRPQQSLRNLREYVKKK